MLTSERSSTTSPNLVVSVKDLIKQYGAFPAVQGINFDIHRGEIFGLIGPDGAGKTTTFHILAGIMDQTHGDVVVLQTKPRDVRLQIGYLTQQFSLYQDLSVFENIEYAARIREVPDRDYLERRDQYLRIMNLYRFGERLAGQLSGGMKQKLALCCALIARPRLLLLDEPTTGVDPVSRRDFWDILASVASEGVTVAVATPYLDEAERCNRVALMYKGTIYQTGTPAQLKESLNLARLEVRTNKIDDVLKTLESFEQMPNNTIADVQEFGDRLDVLVRNSQLGSEQINLATAPLRPFELTIDPQEPTLENVFVMSLKAQATAGSATFPFSKVAVRPAGEAIAAQSINKHFRNFQAVKDVSLTINYGEIYGLLGANGAGKTTTIKMLCGLMDPSSGTMKLAGRKSDLRSVELRRQIGYMSQKFVLYDDLSVIENLNFYCGAQNVPPREKRERLDWALSTFDLVGQEKTITGSLPGGWKQRLSFAASVLHQPSILFLDEPTSGVDPVARRQLWRYIRQFAVNGAAVLVTTHFLEEAEHCERLGFMAAGELVAQGTPSEIKHAQPGQLLELNVSDIQAAYHLLRKLMEPWKVSIFGSRLHVVADEPEVEKPRLQDALGNAGIQINSLRPIPFSLEDAFINISQRAGQEAA